MAESVGQIGLDLVVNEGSFRRQMAGIGNLAKKAGMALAAAFSVKKIIDFGKECVNLGSDLAEVQNVVDVTFPNMTAQVDKFAKSAMTSFGLSETMAKQYTGMFGAMAKAFGFSEQAAYEMGTTLTGLAGDVASFYNISQDEAYTKLKSVFSGETETLKDLGVVMTQNALDAYALANGYGKTTAKMSELEKVSLRYAFVQDQLSAATGDFARTSDSWANQVRIMKLQMQSFMATVGQGLINLFTPVIKVINLVLSKLMTLANVFKAFTELITGKKSASVQAAGTGKTAADSLNSAAGAADNLKNSTTGAGKAAKKAAKEMRSLMSFDQVNKLDSKSSSDNSSGTGGAGAGGGISSVDLGSGALDQMDSATNKFAKKMAGYFEKIKKAVEPTTNALKNLWNNGLKKLGTFAWNSLKDFYTHFLVPVGKWVLGKGLPEFIDALNEGLMKIDFDKINDALKDLWDALAPFAINVGEGLLWFWKNVLVPVGTWTANEVVPRFLKTLSTAITILNSVIDALKPLFLWFWNNVLKPLAQWSADLFLKAWDAINATLTKFSDWCSNNPDKIQTIAKIIAVFFAAFEAGKVANAGLKLAEFIINAGSLGAAIKLLTADLATNTAAFISNTAAKIADKAETAAIVALYAKDFVVNLAKSTAELIKQAAQFAINTAAKIADTAAQIAQTAATAAWNVVCGIATVATTALGAAFTFLTSPIGLVILSITALIAAGVLIYKNWDTIKKKAKELWDGIKNVFSGIADWFKEKFEAARDAVHKAFSGIGKWFKNRYDDIKKVFDAVGKWFGDKFNIAYEKVKTAFKGIGKWFKSRYDDITGVFSGIGGWFKDRFGEAWDNIKGAFKNVGSFFKGLWKKIVGCFTNVGTKIGNAVGGAFKSSVNAVFKTVENIVNGFIKTINGAIKIINKIPGVNIGKINTVKLPRLAQGGYVKPNTPQLAMIGDNRHQGEVVAPEDKLKEMAAEAARMSGGSSVYSAEILKVLLQILDAINGMNLELSIDGKKLKDVIVKKINQNTIATGVCEIIT